MHDYETPQCSPYLALHSPSQPIHATTCLPAWPSRPFVLKHRNLVSLKTQIILKFEVTYIIAMDTYCVQITLTVCCPK